MAFEVLKNHDEVVTAWSNQDDNVPSCYESADVCEIQVKKKVRPMLARVPRSKL